MRRVAPKRIVLLVTTDSLFGPWLSLKDVLIESAVLAAVDISSVSSKLYAMYSNRCPASRRKRRPRIVIGLPLRSSWIWRYRSPAGLF